MWVILLMMVDGLQHLGFKFIAELIRSITEVICMWSGLWDVLICYACGNNKSTFSLLFKVLAGKWR